MKLSAALATVAILLSLPGAQAQETQMNEDVRAVAPGLDRYTHDTVMGDLWKRPDLSSRDRSVVTLAALVPRGDIVQLPEYLKLELDHGVKPREISEIITHLAFYSGWGNAMSAIPATKQIFAARNIAADELPLPSPKLLPLHEAAEAQRKSRNDHRLARYVRECCTTPRRFCSATFGCALT